MTRCAAALLSLAFLTLPIRDAAAAGPLPAGFIDRFEIKSREPAFMGKSFGEVGAYERITAMVSGRVDPAHALNAGTVDLDLAPRVEGAVEWTADVMILRPAAAAKGGGMLLYDVVNRGQQRVLSVFNEGSADLTVGDGTGFLMKRGVTVVWSGWQGDIPLKGDQDGRMGAGFPVATRDGSPIVGMSSEEKIFDDVKSPGVINLSYPKASRDQAKAELTVRTTPDAPARTIAPSQWAYGEGEEVRFSRPPEADAGAIYRFVYPARDPVVMGLGFLAVRDLVSFLRHEKADAHGGANPLGDLRFDLAFAYGNSQSGRFLRDLLWQGGNVDALGRRLFDAILPNVSGARRTFTNFRFSHPGSFSRQHEDHLTPGDQFPFSYGVATDPITGAKDGLFRRCLEHSSCPRVIQVDSSLEFWQGRASLLVTGGAGHGLTLPDNVRAYLVSSTEHAPPRTPQPAVPCGNLRNPAPTAPFLRAMFVAMVDWVRTGKEPPPSRYPSLKDRTLADPADRKAVGFPDLSKAGLTYSGAHNALNLANYRVVPPVADPLKRYRVLVPTTDADGIDVPGVRLPDVDVPLGTHTGWNLRKDGFAAGDLCGLNGSFLPFAQTQAQREASGDPRLSVAERYSSHGDYVAKVRTVANRLRDSRYLLPEDAEAYVAKAVASAVGASRGVSYFVDPNGDDARQGTTPEQAWRTLDKVNATTFQPGDRILFESGAAFKGRLWPKGSGEAGRPVSIDRYGEGAKPRIDGGGIEAAVYLEDQAHWEISGLEITNDAPEAGLRRGVLVVGRKPGGVLRHIVLRGLDIHNIKGKLGAEMAEKLTGGIGIEARGAANAPTFDDLVIEDCSLSSLDNTGIYTWSEAQPHPRAADWERTRNTRVVIRGNRLTDIGKNAIVIRGALAPVIERNVIGRAAARLHGNAIFVFGSQDAVMQFNEVFGTRFERIEGAAFDSDYNSIGTVIQYNYSHDNGGGLVNLCANPEAKAPRGYNDGTIVRYNISQNETDRVIAFDGPVTNTQIYNNTIYVGEGLAPRIVEFDIFGNAPGYASGATFTNNIIYNLGSGTYSMGESRGVLFEANCVFGKHPANEPADAKKITVDPDLIAPGTAKRGLDSLDGYRLRDSSPCRDSGLQIPANGTRDFWKNPLYSGPPDRGAHEWSSRRP